MHQKTTTEIINEVFEEIEILIDKTRATPEDEMISGGNVAICIIDEDGEVYGKMYGEDRPTMRKSYKIAWTKASQVWLTGISTGEYERLVFNGEVPENANGIENPDLIGWIGGQPLILSNGIKYSVGFSGFRGTTDLEIVRKAFSNLNLITKK